MSNKFTEEQYQNIIKEWRSENTYVHQTEAVIDYLIGDLNVDVTLMGDIALAIANPLTREWAHDQFVEKEKKYYWTSKTLDNSGAHYQLYRTRDNMIIAIVVPAKSKMYYEKDIDYAIAESEVKLWGFNPEMFDKEEA